MGIGVDIAADWLGDWHAALAALAWQVDLGVTEVVGDGPVNRYDLAEAVRPAPKAQSAPVVDRPPVQAGADVAVAAAVAAAVAVAGRAQTLDALRDAMAGYDHCDLKRGARNLVFAGGNPAARVLVLGEAPSKDEDQQGRPFVGPAGQLLDRMFAEIGLDRAAEDPAKALYLTTVLPWRPPGDRDPEPQEIAMMRPFLERHITLVNPEIIVVMGNTPLLAMTGTMGILRARGVWGQALGKPLLPMVHPAYLLRNPIAKREAWADLLAVRARLG